MRKQKAILYIHYPELQTYNFQKFIYSCFNAFTGLDIEAFKDS